MSKDSSDMIVWVCALLAGFCASFDSLLGTAIFAGAGTMLWFRGVIRGGYDE